VGTVGGDCVSPGPGPGYGEEARPLTPTATPQTPVPPAPVPSVASLPGVKVPGVGVEVSVLQCEEPLPEGASSGPGGNALDQSQSKTAV